MSLEEVLARWMRRNATDVVAVLDFLRRNPFEFNSLATLAALDCPPTVLPFGAPDSGRERVLEWLRSADFGACAAGCYRPVVQFQNGVKLDWPEFVGHSCEPATASMALPSRVNGHGRPRNAVSA